MYKKVHQDRLDSRLRIAHQSSTAISNLTLAVRVHKQHIKPGPCARVYPGQVRSGSIQPTALLFACAEVTGELHYAASTAASTCPRRLSSEKDPKSIKQIDKSSVD